MEMPKMSKLPKMTKMLVSLHSISFVNVLWLAFVISVALKNSIPCDGCFNK